jgi:RecB family endonuclease NucS
VELTFCPPPGEKDGDRTVFLKAKGYYDIHLDAGGEPRWDVIDRVYNEPGFCVRLANERYWMMIHNARQAPFPPK